MSLKQEIETWVAADAAYDNNDFEAALKSFELIANTSKILFNCGVIHATLGEHENAVDFYQRAIQLDQYLAVAYHQQGVSNFLRGDFEEALANFNDTLLYLRGNNNIDYEQLGLKFKLYSCEALFNRGLCYIYLQQFDAGMSDLTFAAKEKAIPEHDVIDEAIAEKAEGYTVFSIPVGTIYRPNEAKVKNLKTRDFLGKARLVAATDRQNTFTGFQGSELKNRTLAAQHLDDKPEEGKSYAAQNLVKPNLRSRQSRQQSEPPLNRNMFPPTPPPEQESKSPTKEEKSPDLPERSDKTRSAPKPKPLDLSIAGFEKPRLGTVRSASERPGSGRDRSGALTGDRNRERDRDSERYQPRSSSRSRRRQTDATDDSVGGGIDDMLSIYSAGASSMGRRSRTGGASRLRDSYIEEEEGEDYYGESFSDPEWEIMSKRRSYASTRSGPRGPPTRAAVVVEQPRQPPQQAEAASVNKIRVKVHAEDVRYVMITPATEFADFVNQIRTKFALGEIPFKLKMRDEEDFITMSDQDDLDMIVQTAVEEAGRAKEVMGKMEVWLQEA